TTDSILTSVQLRFADTPQLRDLNWLVASEESEQIGDEWTRPEIGNESLAFLQYTSGSTSLPKGVMLSHGNLLHNLELIQDCFGTSAESNCVIWLPPYHDMGLIGGILQPLFTGYPVTLMAPVDFIQRPLRWLETISRLGATVSGGPNFAYELCLQKITPEQRDTLDLSKWEIAFSGAEPVRAETLERFAEFFAPCGFRKEAFYPCYGLAEGTLLVSGGAKAEAPIVCTFDGEALSENRVAQVVEAQESDRQLVSSGRLSTSRQKIVIANPTTGARCADDEVGEIWVSGPSVAQGYWNREEQTKEVFQARLADTGEGPFLRTGDLGFVQHGELYVTGRLKDLIIIRGRNYYPQDIEFAVQESHPAVKNSNGAAFAIEIDGEERLVIVQEIERAYRKANLAEVVTAVRQAVSEEHQLQVHAVVLIKPVSIPKTSSGKVQRHACKAGWEANTLDVLFCDVLDGGVEVAIAAEFGVAEGMEQALDLAAVLALAPEERRAVVVTYLHRQAARVLRVSTAHIQVEQSLNALGLDSLMAVELKQELEENFGIFLPFTRFLAGPSIAELADEVCLQLEDAGR
ncbi:MAG: AMP-binding protein, partial [Tumebacillaceae bacterium]